jgi:ribosomal protein S12 methylthiotransferase
MLGCLKKENYQITPDPMLAEVIIVNTCSFIQASIEESIDTLLQMADYKNMARCEVLVASGCLPQRYAADLEKQLPEVDLFIGTGQYHLITQILANPDLQKRTYVNQPAFIHSETDERVFTPSFSAFLKISEGCNRRCSFCIIPKLRGNVRSRSVESLVTEASRLANLGIKELNLVGQDLTEYGMENRYQERLETLLPELCKIEGIEWIRLHYVYPDQFSDALIQIMASEPKIVKYLDMPIQHTHDEVLKRMNRRLTRANLFALIEKLRAQIPGIVFRTSIIVGFPGETEEQFQALCEDLRLLKLDYVGVFRYSKEPGTKAFDLDGQISAQTKRKREKILQKVLEENIHQIQAKHVGITQIAVLEGVSSESELLWSARLPTQAAQIDGKIFINDIGFLTDSAISQLKPGQFVPVEITEVMGADLIGRIVPWTKKNRETALLKDFLISPTQQRSATMN